MGPEVVVAEACRVDHIDDPGGFSMTFRTITRRLPLAAAIAALATSAAVQAAPASAAPPDSGLGAQGAGDGPVGPSGCRGDCGIFAHPNPNPRPKPKPKPCGGSTGRSCEPHAGCSGGVCLPPPPPGSQLPAPPAKTIKCTGRMLD